MKRLFLILVILAISFSSVYYLLLRDFPHQSSTIFYNGAILTLEGQQPEAIMLEKGKISVLGSEAEIMALKQANTQLIDLEGKTLMPGFVDPHSHPALSTFLYKMEDLSGFTHATAEELWTHFEKVVAEAGSGEWIICKGLDPILTQNLKAPTIQYLDKVAPENPVLILAQSLHSYWANSIAFQAVGIDKNSPNPSEHSFYEKDSLGELTGFIAEQEAFAPFASAVLEQNPPAVMIQSTLEVMKEYAKAGNTTVAGLGLSLEDATALRLYEHLAGEKPKLLNQILSKIGMLPERRPLPRLVLYIRHDRAFMLPDSPNNGDDFYKIVGIKHWYDGSPYTGSMYLEQPYEESELTREGLLIQAGHKGEALVESEEMVAFIKEYSKKGWQIAVHCQGDQASQEVLEAFEEVAEDMDIKPFRNRLEHCLLLPESALGRFQALNMSPSFHINHLYYYGAALQEDILGAERAERLLPIAAVAANKMPFSLHADQPMFPSDPFHLMQTAIRRESKEGQAIGKEHEISILEALKAMTIHAAWQLHMEDKIGSIAEGKYADLIVLDQNPLETPVDRLREVKVLATYVAGNLVE